MNPRRLYRSRTDHAITGIAGGMAEYLEVDPTIVRILWVLADLFTGGLALLLYIILVFVIPMNPYPAGQMPAGAPGTGAAWTASAAPTWSPDWNARYDAERAARAERPGRAGLIIGTVLIVFGVIALADVALPTWVGGALFGPALLLALGAALLVASLRRHEAPVAAAAAASAPAPAAAPAGSVETPVTPPAAPVMPAVAVDDPDATSPVSYLAESDPS